MTSLEFSPEDRSRAEQIYRRISWGGRTALVVLCLSAFLGLCSVSPHLNRFFSALIYLGLLLIVYFLPDTLARAHLRKTGLSLEHIERRIVWRGMPVVLKPLKFYAKGQLNSNGLRSFLIWLLSLFALFWFFVRFPVLDRWFAPSWQGNVIVLLATILMKVYELWERKLPVLRLDNKGVSSGGIFFWPRTVPWSQVADVEEVKTWDFRGGQQPARLNFRDGKGKTRLRVLCAPGGSFVQEIEAHLRGESKISSS